MPDDCVQPAHGLGKSIIMITDKSGARDKGGSRGATEGFCSSLTVKVETCSLLIELFEHLDERMASARTLSSTLYMRDDPRRLASPSAELDQQDWPYLASPCPVGPW